MKTFFLLFILLSPLAFALNFGGLEVCEYEVGIAPTLIFAVREPVSSGTTIEVYSNDRKVATATFTTDVAAGETIAIADRFFSHGTIRCVPQVVSINTTEGREICRTEDFKLRGKADLSGREGK